MTDLQKLVAMCPPAHMPRPTQIQAGSNWVIPQSHRELIAACGPGCFDEFLWIYAEGAEYSTLDIPARTEDLRSVLGKYLNAETRTILDEYGVGAGDLVRWGGTGNADLLVWMPVGEPDEWPTIIIGPRQFLSMAVPGTSTSIVLGLLTGRLEADSFRRTSPVKSLVSR